MHAVLKKNTMHEGKVRGESAAGGYVQRPRRVEDSAATDMFVNLFFKPSHATNLLLP
jgi:hypothetical protein